MSVFGGSFDVPSMMSSSAELNIGLFTVMVQLLFTYGFVSVGLSRSLSSSYSWL